MTTLFISYSSKDKRWADQVHQVLSKDGYQSLFLDSHPDDGIHAGADWEQDLWRKLRQSRGVIALCSVHWLDSPWCLVEAMMARERGKPLFMLLSADVTDGQVPDFLKNKQSISLADMPESEMQERLCRGLAEEGLKDDFRLPDRPYPGLGAYQESDAAVFFGRFTEISRVQDMLNRCRRDNARGFIVILGASGCGKSSLVRAGVLPRLRSASSGAGSTAAWVVVPPCMGGRGLHGLAISLAHGFIEAQQPRELAVTGGLETASNLRALAAELILAHGAPEASVLFVLDQLEEVFGASEGSDARTMLRLLLEASAEPGSPVVVLATMRSDFLNAFQLFEGAAERYEEITLDPMRRSRFGEIIEGPAGRFGIDLDHGLSERMVEETAYEDALPLLAFTLEKLYARCRAQGRLTIEAYDQLGGVSAAIKQTADAILEQSGYARLPADDRRMRDLRRAFYSLVRVGEEGQFTRRTARSLQMPASCGAVLQRFVRDRLLVSGADERGEPTLNVAHEALFRVWDTLSGWLRDNRKALALRSQIEEAAAEWEAEHRSDSRAWAEERILATVRQIEESGVSLADVKHRTTVDAFLGPTDPTQLEVLPSLGAAEDVTAGGGRYGDAWRLPLSHEARASVGVRLALLGDPRPGVGLRADGLPDIEWCRIERGDVTIDIRADWDDPNSKIAERLTQPVETFWMARYPITIDQYQAFLRDCHRNGEWRLPTGFPVQLPGDHPPPKHWARYGNHPADNINWLDAVAFCHWLGARLGFHVRLPSEAEWQLAATGGDAAMTYPWSPDWDSEKEPWRANTSESGLNRSTAVGMYPAGSSPAGLLDMAGTIYEWCEDRFEDPGDAGRSWLSGMPSKRRRQHEDRRVLRGGSWDLVQDFARSAVRGRFYPYARRNYLGFRVVSSRPSLSSSS